MDPITLKTCIVKIFEAIRSIIYNNKPGLMPNIFNNNNICEIDSLFWIRIEYSIMNLNTM